MTILVTGAAGFIGSHLVARLLADGREVVGIDNMNTYYDVTLKQARLDRLNHPGFTFRKVDVADRDAMADLARAFPRISAIAHLAAQAGVRYSLTDPYAYVTANVMGQVVMLELARQLGGLDRFVYASSSSVYGRNETLPFAVGDRVDWPTSLYGATKRADELIAEVYAHLYRLPAIGLRFFTVYGPWGRPDMAPFLFTQAILTGRPIHVFNNGEMWRDFTYIDDIVDGIVAALHAPANGSAHHRVYNLGNHRAEKLTDFIAVLEATIGRKAELVFKPMQAGEVARTCADIADSARDLGFRPGISIQEGLPRFVAWYRDYYSA